MGVWCLLGEHCRPFAGKTWQERGYLSLEVMCQSLQLLLNVECHICCCTYPPSKTYTTPVSLRRHVEDRWPRKLALTLTTSGNPPRSATRSTTFPTPALAATAAAAATAAHSPANAAAGGNGNGVAGAAEGAAQAPAVAAAFDAPGVVGEKRYAAGSALHAAVVNLAAGLAQVGPAAAAPAAPCHAFLSAEKDTAQCDVTAHCLTCAHLCVFAPVCCWLHGNLPCTAG